MNYREITARSKARALLALKLRRDGLTFREIGERIGRNGPVTVETARQAVKKGERIERRYAVRVRDEVNDGRP